MFQTLEKVRRLFHSILYIKVGAHRRVLLEDVKKYEITLRKTRKKTMDELAREAQEMGLGY